jgi:glycerol uptake facilitator-like aquaporin
MLARNRRQRCRRRDSVRRALVAEFLGSLLLAAAVVGSGIMAERLAAGNAAVALLANTAATVTVLGVLIAVLAPISGAHFNPAVTLAAVVRKKLAFRDAAIYVLVQIAGCCAGAMLAHVMFELPIVQSSAHARDGIAQWISEIVATAGLVFVAFTSPSVKEAAWRVPAWIAGAYWFTASTSFANPAITVGRSLTDTFSGIRPQDAPAFVAAQIVGAAVGLLLLRVLSSAGANEAPPEAMRE